MTDITKERLLDLLDQHSGAGSSTGAYLASNDEFVSILKLALQALNGVGVRKLVWREYLSTHTASTPFGSLVVRAIPLPDNESCIGYAIWGEEEFGTVLEAKAAAQADYEQRILSAIEAPAAEGEGYPRLKTVRAHKHTCANVQPGSTYVDKCDCWALDTAGNAIEITRPSPAAASEVTEEDAFKWPPGPYCPSCRGSGQPGGVKGGPELGLCHQCKGTGYLTASLKGDRS